MREKQQDRGRTLWIGLLVVLTVALFAAATVIATPQQKQKGKPGGGGGGGKPGASLVLDLTTPDQISVSGFGPLINVYSFDPNDGPYTLSWTSNKLKGRKNYDSAWIGDVDNDGEDEVVGFCGNLSIYESGSTGDYAYFSESLNAASGSYNPVMVADVDGDSYNEVVINLGDRVEVWECDESPSCWPVWSSSVDTVKPPSGLEIGDVNGDGIDDIVVGTRSTGWNAFGSVRAYTWNESGWTETESVPLFELDPDTGLGAATVRAVAVADVDGLPGNEIVATLTQFGETASDGEGWLAVWKHEGGGINSLHAESLGANTAGAGVDTANFDGTGGDELVVGVNRGLLSTVQVGKFTGGAFSFPTEWEVMTGAFVGHIRVGNTDDDPDLEVVVATGQRYQIYDFSVVDGFSQVFASPEDRELSWISIQ